MKKLTNMLLKKIYDSGLKVDLNLDIDTSKSNAVQIDINIKPMYFNDFAIFYGTKDDSVNFSSIFEVEELDFEKAKEIFNKDKGIFDSIIREDESETIHLYCQINKNLFTEEKIDEIIKYLYNKHEITEYLKGARK